tara:strand:+ start:1349 stop:2779 length:1431 start_codon:yes stop_codon:yes gene_type:complete
MAFSQQSYTGQGIVQPTERSRVGEFLGEGLAGLGEGIGQGIEKFAQRKEEMKKREQFKKGTITALTALGADADLLKGMEATELAAYAQMYPQISEGKFYSELTEARQKRDVPVDFAPQVDAAEARLQRAQESAGFRPEFTYAGDQFQPMPDSAPSFAGQPVIRKPLEDQTLNILLRGKESEAAVQDRSIYDMLQESKNIPADFKATSIQGFAPTRPEPVTEQTYRPAPVRGATQGPEAMPGPSEDVVKAAKDLELLKVAEQKGETRSETATEVRDRLIKDIPNLVKENPLMAKQAYELLYDQDNKLTFENKLSLLKYQDSVKSRFIPGLGTAPSVETAKEMRTLQLADDQIQTGIGRLLEILDTPGKRFDFNLKKEANTIVGLLTGALRVPIVGPGAFSESEKEMIEKIIANPTKLFSIDSNTRTSLKTLSTRMRADRDSYAKLIGLDPYQEGTASGQQASDVSRMRFNTSTGLIE